MTGVPPGVRKTPAVHRGFGFIDSCLFGSPYPVLVQSSMFQYSESQPFGSPIPPIIGNPETLPRWISGMIAQSTIRSFAAQTSAS